VRVGAADASFRVLADAVSTAQSFVDVFIGVYTLLIFVYILTSWVRLPYSVTMNRVQRFLYDVCEPYLRLFRRVLPALGPIDLSPIVAVIVLLAIDQIVTRLLGQLR
jgi:YggT family protein